MPRPPAKSAKANQKNRNQLGSFSTQSLISIPMTNCDATSDTDSGEEYDSEFLDELEDAHTALEKFYNVKSSHVVSIIFMWQEEPLSQ